MALRTGRRERDLQQRVKSVGGRWDPGRRVWILGCDVAESLNLLSRVVGGDAWIGNLVARCGNREVDAGA